MEHFVVLAANYLLGSIPSAYILGKLIKGIDIREHGSGNVGATNAFRVLGKWVALVVLLFDALKGILGVLFAQKVGGPWFVVFAALVVMAGHNYSVFLGFKGGRGVATGAGILIALSPKTVIFAVLIFASVLWTTKYVSLSSIIAALSVPISMFVLNETLPVKILGLIAVAFVIFRHIPNIKRLMNGTERKINDRIR